MYSWRARLGILVPSGIMVTEPEFNILSPEGVICHYNRYKFAGSGSNDKVFEDLQQSEDYIISAGRNLLDIDPSAIAIVGTATTFIGGHGYDEKLIQKIKSASDQIPVTTTSTSVITALDKMAIKKISLGMPYFENVARTAIKFVEDSGIKVIKSKWLEKSGRDIWEMSRESLYQLARDIDDPASEAIFISCINLHTIDIIDKIECDLQKPVITSNQATMWNLLRLAGIKDKIVGYGRLLAGHY